MNLIRLPEWENIFGDIQKLLDLASRVSYLRTGVTSKSLPVGVNLIRLREWEKLFGDIQKLLELASRVSYARTRGDFRVD